MIKVSNKEQLYMDKGVTPIDSFFRERVIAILESKKISLTKFACLMSVSPSTLSRYFDGSRVPSIYTIKYMAHLLEVPIEYLVLSDTERQISNDVISGFYLLDKESGDVFNPSKIKDFRGFNIMIDTQGKVYMVSKGTGKIIRECTEYKGVRL